MSWQEILKYPAPGHHIAQVYQDESFLVEALDLFVLSGIREGEGVLVIADRPHTRSLQQRLRGTGLDLEAARLRGQIVFLDAEDTLASFMVCGMPDWNIFKELIGGLIRKVGHAYPRLRAYGEMVNTLSQRGNFGGAIQLEKYWNELAGLMPFSLFCVYTLDIFNHGAYGGTLKSICQTHSHFIPARNYDHFEGVLEQASREVLGHSFSVVNRMFSLATPTLKTRMPESQARLLWLRENMPSTAEKVLDQAQKSVRDSRNF